MSAGASAAAISGPRRFTLTLTCVDRTGIVNAVSGFLSERDCNILDSAQFRDESTHQFFMRVCFETGARVSLQTLAAKFATVSRAFSMQSQFYDAAVKSRVLILVSKFGHCLNDLLYRHSIGALPMDIPAIVSNHRDFAALAAAHGVEFHHLPITPDTKATQEARILALFDEYHCDLMVLARYMQILSPELCAQVSGRAINIHHSFLPSFQGAKPYHQAHERAVKLIGATAHYVTRDLDEGPIIEQDVARVDHAMSVEDYVAVGRDIETGVLARAVKWHVEHRILLHGHRTVIFQ